MQSCKPKRSLCKQHPGENYSLLCLEEDCPERGPICTECLLFDHPGHVTKPIVLALEEIRKDLRPQLFPLKSIIKLDQLQIRFQAVVSRLGPSRRVVEPELYIFLEKIQANIKNYKSICKRILQSQESSPQFTTLIKGYKFYQRQEEDRNQSNFQMYLQQTLTNVQDRCDDFEQAVNKKMEISEILKLLAPIQSETFSSYSFSQANHHTSIVLSPDSLTATQKNNYSTNFAFIEPILQGKKKLNCKKSIKILINKLSSWLSIGVAYLSFAKKNNYYFNTGSVGHGGYMISFNGYTWHHTDSSLNSNYTSFSYNQGDTVIITINPQSSKIIFQRSGCATYQLPYEKLPNEQLYFCVSLSTHEESVSITK